jgi:light-regulated signal transduction histidine kinase (bacteriophytochrome)
MRRLVRELEQSNTALSQFASVASHDLQEPLRTISAFIHLFLKDHAGQLDKKGEEYLTYARNGAARMQKLVADLLQYSQVGSATLDLTSVNTETLLDDVIKMMRIPIGESEAEIVEKGTFPTIVADDIQLTRLFQNLLSNALKFHRPGTKPIVEVEGKENGNEFVFSVKDNGIGISRQDIPKVFQIFKRLNSAHDYPGSGIGLATCQRIVERHGGRISVDSRPGEGTRFSISLPRRQTVPSSSQNHAVGSTEKAAHEFRKIRKKPKAKLCVITPPNQ